MAVATGSLLEVMRALADQVAAGVEPSVPGLQVQPYRLFNPTPPAVDVYPADPFQEQIAMGYQNREAFFTLRARVLTVDNQAGQELLLNLMDPRDGWLLQAISSDRSLGGTVQDTVVEGPSGFRIYQDVSGDEGLLGCEWRVRVIL